jgi:hypothetical protein
MDDECEKYINNLIQNKEELKNKLDNLKNV